MDEVPLKNVTTSPEADIGQSDDSHRAPALIDQSNEPDNMTSSDEPRNLLPSVSNIDSLTNLSNTNEVTGDVSNSELATTPTSLQDEIYSTVAVRPGGTKSTVRIDEHAAPDVQL